MEDRVLKRANETQLEFIKRITFGKQDKTYDIDYIEWAKLCFDKEWSSDESRKRFYGVIALLEVLNNQNIKTTPTSQLKEIREKVGELNVVRRQTQLEKNELNKIRKDFIKSISIAEELEQYMEENDFKVIIPEYCNFKIDENNDFCMVVHITDWHIGYVIDDCKGNYYNWDIANKRVDNLINECYKYIEMYNIKKVYVVNTGDIIENTYMRKNQSQFCEFTQSNQINKAIEIIYRFLVALCDNCNVEYDSVYGNHDRSNGDKTANLDGDNAEVIIREQLRKYKKISNNQRLEIINRRHTDKEIKKEINGLNCKFIHGESKCVDGKQLIKNEMSVDNEFYDCLFKGHLHNFKIESENNGRYIISTGCLSGYNDYSVTFACSTFASQTIVIMGDRKIELIKDVILQ